MSAQLMTLLAFARARFAMKTLRTREQIDAYQARRLKRFLKRDVPKVEAFSGAQFQQLSDAPVMDKAELMDNFELYNRLGLCAEMGWKIFGREASSPHGFSLGASTGTSGNRGLYMVSDAERYEWLGVILSRAFPDMLRRRERVAVILPQASALYDAANESQRLQLKFFDLARGVEAIVADVAAFDPTTLVAPPRVLTVLAEADTTLVPQSVFSGAEVLDAADRATIEARFGRRVREIYMATEGLFAVACDHGSLHLIEDRVAFEWEAAGEDGLVTPLVTDFTRRTQIMLRYRMNDLLRLGITPCPCGSPHQVIDEIVGRQDDVFHFTRSNGERVTMTPDVIRNTVLDTDRQIADYRVSQTGADVVQLELAPVDGSLLPAVIRALDGLFVQAGVSVKVRGDVNALQETGYSKRRRVRGLRDAAR